MNRTQNFFFLKGLHLLLVIVASEQKRFHGPANLNLRARSSFSVEEGKDRPALFYPSNPGRPLQISRHAAAATRLGGQTAVGG